MWWKPLLCPKALEEGPSHGGSPEAFFAGIWGGAEFPNTGMTFKCGPSCPSCPHCPTQHSDWASSLVSLSKMPPNPPQLKLPPRVGLTPMLPACGYASLPFLTNPSGSSSPRLIPSVRMKLANFQGEWERLQIFTSHLQTFLCPLEGSDTPGLRYASNFGVI